MKRWIIVAWDLTSGKGTALGEVTGTYDEACSHVRGDPRYFTHGVVTLCGVIEP
jgi:hypothetical protein